MCPFPVLIEKYIENNKIDTKKSYQNNETR